jgi:hypothetical protein
LLDYPAKVKYDEIDRKLKSGMAELTAVQHAKEHRNRIAAQPTNRFNLEMSKRLDAVITALDSEHGAKETALSPPDNRVLAGFHRFRAYELAGPTRTWLSRRKHP